MRKDIFVVGARLLGVWQFLGSLNTLLYIIFAWIGYDRPPSYSHSFNLIHFGIEFVIGLYLILRPYHLFYLIERFAESDDEGQGGNYEVKETSDVK